MLAIRQAEDETRNGPGFSRSIRRSTIETARSRIGSASKTSPFRHSVPEPVVRYGDLIDGRYCAADIIGEGGMSIVLAGRDVLFDRRVAIKMPRHETWHRKDLMDRFRREIRMTASLSSEHVVQVCDAGELANGVPYMVMELLEGQDLGAVLKGKGPLPVQEAVGYLLQACEALEAIYDLGVVHRDLKPENLFLTVRPDRSTLMKIIDFGLSSGTDANQTGGGSTTIDIMGSPPYMSPEQVVNFQSTDIRSDIWSLGAILYELLTGSLVFPGASVGTMLTKICYHSVTPARRLRPDLPVELDEVILRCLERDREKRFQDVRYLAAALRPFAATRQLA